MSITTRTGPYDKFDPSKAMPGEVLTVISGDPHSVDGLAVYMCFKAGTVKRMATYEDMKQDIENATVDVQEQFAAGLQAAITAAGAATSSANSATTKANSAAIDAAAATKNATDIYNKLKDLTVTELLSRIQSLETAMSEVIATDESDTDVPL